MRRDQFLSRTTLTPYRPGEPTFILTLWDTDGDMPPYHHKARLGYMLVERGVGVIFKGESFGASPLYPIDSEETVRTLLGFLSLRPGDTDPDYFDGYTPDQLAFAQRHGEALSLYTLDDDPQPLDGFEIL